MTVVHPRASWGWRTALIAAVAVALLALSASAGTEAASAHGSCYHDGLAPYKSPSGAQIRGTGNISCDYKHEVVRVCAAVEKLQPTGWEPFGDVRQCNQNANAVSASVRDARACAESGSYRTEVRVKAVGANGHTHSGGFIRGPITIVCNPSDLAKTNTDDLIWLAG